MHDHDRRFESIEHAIAFNDRCLEQISEEVVRAHALIEKLARRLAALEGRIASVEAIGATQPDADAKRNADELLTDRPPHSAGPPPEHPPDAPHPHPD